MNGATPGQVTSTQDDTCTSTTSTMVGYGHVTNDQFILAIFGNTLNEQKDAWPLVCCIGGNPEDGKYWAQPWPCDTADATQNWYVLPSVFEPNADGEYRAQRRLARKVFCVMLDDVGTKVPLERIEACPPTWRIETSPGNYQVGYIFAAPIDVIQADALKSALIDGGLCDRGATGGSSRWMRLPVGINGKSKYGSPAFQCRMVEWNPERRYPVDEIIDRLELALPQSIDKSVHKPAAGDDVYIARSNENEVITALKARGLYKQALGGGRHEITCPWLNEHTNQADQGSAYFEPSDLYPIGGFKCQHGHGDKYRIKALLEFLGVTIQAAKHKPIIMVSAGEIDRIVGTAELELAATKRFYQRGGLIVCVAQDSKIGEAWIKALSPSALLRALSGCAIWMRYDNRYSGSVVIDPPARHVAVLFDAGSYVHLPMLTGIARQPHLRPDGTLVMDMGFDAATGLFGVFDPCRFNVPNSPSKVEALEALQELKGLLSEFEFCSESDLSAALAGMLTATVRPCLAVAPMIHVRAPVISSGKSFLCNILAAFASPSASSAFAFPTSEEECQKLLLAALMESPGAIVFDNLTSDIVPFKSLCSAMTEEHLTGRILGLSKMVTVDTRVLFLSSGNNVNPTKDMSRRCITIALDPKVETPATRHFKGNPLATIRADREHYVSLVLTIIRAWITAGSPTAQVKPLGNYEQWTAWVRQPLIWLGLMDPASSVFSQLEQDPDREALGRVLHAWHFVHGNKPTMVREAVGNTRELGNEEFRDALRDVSEERGEINTRRLGRWIARRQGRIVDGMRFEKSSGRTSAERWSVKSVSSVRSVLFSEDNKRVGEIGDDGLSTPLNPDP